MTEVAEKAQINTFKKWMIFISMLLTIFIIAYNDTSVITAIVMIRNQLGMSPVEQLWAINAYTLAAAPLIIIAAQVATRYGQRRVYFISLALYILASVVTALAGNGTWVIVGRALTGLSSAALTPGSLAITCAVFNDERQPFAVSLWSSVCGLGLAAGPILGGLFSTYMTWRFVFWLNVIVCVMAGLIMFAMRSGTLERRLIRFDFKGVVALAIGLFCVTFALNQGDSWGWSNVWIWVILIGGLIVLGIFFFIEKLAQTPLVHFEFFKLPAFTYGVIGSFTTIFIMMGIFYFFSIFTQNPLGMNFSPIQSGLGVLPVALLIFIAAPFTPKIAGKVGMRNLIAVSLFIEFIGFVWLYKFVTIQSTYADLWLPLLFVGVGQSVCFSLIPGVGMGALKQEDVNEGSGMINTAFYISATIASAIGTILFVIASHVIFNHTPAIMHLTSVLREDLIKALLAHKASVVHVITHSKVSDPHAVTVGIKKAVTYGFNMVMLMCAIVTAIAFLLTVLIVKNDKKV